MAMLRLAASSLAVCMLVLQSVLPAAASAMSDAALQRRILERISAKDIEAQAWNVMHALLPIISDMPSDSHVTTISRVYRSRWCEHEVTMRIVLLHMPPHAGSASC